MKKILLSLILFTALFGCKETAEDKRADILENQLENAATRQEIKADSLKEEAKRLEEEAKKHQDKADNLLDSSRSI